MKYFFCVNFSIKNFLKQLGVDLGIMSIIAIIVSFVFYAAAF